MFYASGTGHLILGMVLRWDHRWPVNFDKESGSLFPLGMSCCKPMAHFMYLLQPAPSLALSLPPPPILLYHMGGDLASLNDTRPDLLSELASAARSAVHLTSQMTVQSARSGACEGKDIQMTCHRVKGRVLLPVSCPCVHS